MRYGFVSQDGDDAGLAARMVTGGLKAVLDSETGVVWVVPVGDWPDIFVWYRSVENHYQCVYDGTG